MAEHFTRPGDSVTVHGHTLTVAAACTGELGRWHCATHDETFRNNLEANGHTDADGDHVMVWICSDHGPEAQGA